MSDADLILLAGVLLAAGIVAAMAADQVKVPGLILFLALGMIVGEDVIGVRFDDVELTRTLGTIGLILILYEGGLSAGWNQIRPVLGVSLSLAIVGTLVTAAIAGAAAIWLFDLGTLEGMLVGAAVAATDSAAIFAVLRGSMLRRRLARALEGESGMNDPIALLLVTGLIKWIDDPGYGPLDMVASFIAELSIGAALGLAVGYAARHAFYRFEFPTPGLYPVASMAAVAISYGLTEGAGGSGFLAVYLTGLILGTGPVPARRTVAAFHQGLSWVAQISLFFLLGLLVDPGGLGAIAPEALALSAVLIFLARPLAAVLASSFAGFTMRERLMLGWAGLRGAIPIWLATFPVIAGVEGSDLLFNAIFFVVVTSTLIQGATFEPLARRLRLTTSRPALPRPLVEIGTIQRLGGAVVAVRIHPGDIAIGRMIKQLGLPRDALVNVIVRDGVAIPPRGSTVVEADDELHLLMRRESLEQVEAVSERWRHGPLGPTDLPDFGLRGSPQIFTVRPTRPDDPDPADPDVLDGIAVLHSLRDRRDSRTALVVLRDGRYAVTGPDLVAIGGRRQLARWAVERAERKACDPAERSWWQEVVGVLTAPSIR